MAKAVSRRVPLTPVCLCVALAAIGAAGATHAQSIDHVDIRRLGEDAEIAIRFTAPLHYLRHAPLDSGTTLHIYTQPTLPAAQDLASRMDSRSAPETDLVPEFTLTYPDTDGSLSIAFASPTLFFARGGSDGRSIIVTVPALPNAKDWIVQMKGIAPEAGPRPAQIVAELAPSNTAARPSAPVSAGRSIEDIAVQRLGNQAEIQIRFTSPVLLARPTPPGDGDSLVLYPQLSRAGASSETRGKETNRVEGIDLIPPFSVSYPEADGSLALRFDRATRYSVEPGPDDRSINIVVPAIQGAKDFSIYVQGAPPGPIATTSKAPTAAPAVAAPLLLAAVSAPSDTPAGSTAPIASAIVPSAPGLASVPPAEPAPPSPAAPPPVSANGTPAAAAAPTAAAPSMVGVRLATPDAPARSAAPIVLAAAPIAQAPAPVPLPEAAPPASAATSIPAPVPAAELPAVAPLTPEEIEARAKSAMEEAQRALASQRGVVAAQRLDKVLALPPNSQSRLAQALMGEAREYSGELRKAKAEYELYLKRYPDGAEAARVKQRLTALNTTMTRTAAATPGRSGLAKPAEWSVYGSVSQYVYRGNSQIETITPPPPGELTFNSDKLSLQDQNSIISTLDLNARKRDATRDTRIVFRDTDTRNHLEGQPQVNRLYNAYFEQSDRKAGYLMRVGRQLGGGGGVFGRFDGVWAGYDVNPTWRVNGVVGRPVEFGTPLTRSVQGVSVDRQPQLGEPGLSVYYIEQPLEGLNDRKAVGLEGRYFDQRSTVFTMLDYDLNFNSLNIVMAQGNWRSDAGTSYFANIDLRKTPPLSLLTALPAQQVIDPVTGLPMFLDLRTAISTAAYTLGVSEMRNQASILTATSRLYSVGFNHPLTPRWQLGADYRLADITGTDGVGAMPAQPGSGASNVYSGTALGTSLALPNDTLVLNASLIDNPTALGQAYNVSYVIPYKAWRFDANFRYYSQSDNQDQKQARVSPSLRIAYRWRDSITLELEAGYENVNETGPLREVHSRRQYFFGGYRWDFH